MRNAPPQSEEIRGRLSDEQLRRAEQMIEERTRAQKPSSPEITPPEALPAVTEHCHLCIQGLA
jgi:hypothetical protein